jgi:hypothetical protein
MGHESNRRSETPARGPTPDNDTKIIVASFQVLCVFSF